ncbi:sensor histidine kinase [Merismopedia glauca]|uniref:histidine kinase n=1 Tax=Merismopedia glauca CCAP 1448/3 TaxID=1296344 RepID=A0A2T1C2E7_9CYAN|nr:HAMP domain-containing sensor histidine kinase [Merismopedia glauca]PSB02450.1 sensor histidine kinase [Merismopedia glauca CCAP 1448/3]
MEVPKWLLPSLSSVWNQNSDSNQEQPSDRTSIVYQAKANREWLGAIQAVQTMLLASLNQSEIHQTKCGKLAPQGLLLSAPVPVFSDLGLVKGFKTGVFNIDPFPGFMPFQLPPASHGGDVFSQSQLWQFPLLPTDPLAREQFCLVLTAKFSIVLVLGTNARGLPTFYFSLAPEEIFAVWQRLQARMRLTSPHYLPELESLWQEYAPGVPSYQTVMEFSRLLLEYMPPVVEVESGDKHHVIHHHETGTSQKPPLPAYTLDLELLQALTHEIRTPLATIKTLTQLLLRRKDLAPEVTKRLESIEYECFQQINRMELIFRAVELANSGFADTQLVHLTSTSLKHLLEQSVPRWQKQALRHNVTLDFLLPQKMPAVVSNPVMLEQVLTGLIESFTRRLPNGGKIQVHVTPAGDRLKLQFQSHPHEVGEAATPKLKQKSLGQLLIFQPETGSISLNLNVTKNLCQILGGKLIFRDRPATGEELTIFLPLEMNRSAADLTTT